MRPPRSAAVVLTGCLMAGLGSPLSALAQNEASPTAIMSSHSSGVDQSAMTGSSVNDSEREIEDQISAGLKSGKLSRADVDRAAAELANIRTQQSELASRDNGINATDAEFLLARLRQLKASIDFHPHAPGTGAVEPALGVPLNAEVPGPLICDAKRVLLAVGRDHAVATVQRYGSANVALIVQAIASPYESTDTISLHVTGGGLNAKIDGARDGAFLVASTTANFSLKSKHKATITADVISRDGAVPQYVKIWGSCSTN